MTWEVNDREFESVFGLAAPRRYEYFIKRAASHGELWGLHGEGGWVIAVDDEGDNTFRSGRTRASQRHVPRGRGRDARAQAIDIDDWVEAWTPQLLRDGLRVAVFQTPADQGVGVSPDRLRHDLQTELSLFDLE